MTVEGDQGRPLLRVVAGGEPTDIELAAVVMAVLALRPGHDRDGDASVASRWADRRQLLRPTMTPGPGAWQASGWRR